MRCLCSSVIYILMQTRLFNICYAVGTDSVCFLMLLYIWPEGKNYLLYQLLFNDVFVEIG